MVGKLGVIVLGMFAFGYALVPIYKAICEMTGINILALGDRNIPGATPDLPANTQVDYQSHHHGGVRCQFARSLGVQAGTAFAAGASG